MPTSKDLKSYPAYFWDIPRVLAQREIRVEGLTYGAAVSLRLKFYAFRKLLATPEAQDALPPEQLAAVNACVVKIEPLDSAHPRSTCAVVFEHSDHTPVGQAINAALRDLGETPRGAPAQLPSLGGVKAFEEVAIIADEQEPLDSALDEEIDRWLRSGNEK